MVFIPVILAGGKGERFWPVSRRHHPKQFLDLDRSGHSLLQTTAHRLAHTAGTWENLWVITSALLEEGVKQQLPQLAPQNLLVEPEGRDTAPAVAWSCWEIYQRYGAAATIGFFPADHWIDDQEKFNRTIQAAIALVENQPAIATLGIEPQYPATGYGYIERGEALGEFLGFPAYGVSRFTEKPDPTTAAEFLRTGRYSWNSGMFIFPVETVLAELQRHAPEILTPLQQQGAIAYGQLPKISIDYALMEKTQLARVLPVAFGWDDLGDWNAVERLWKSQHAQGRSPNLELGKHLGQDSQGNVIYNQNPDEIIVTIGVQDLVIVREGNATLIVPKERTQEIKQILGQLKTQDQSDRWL